MTITVGGRVEVTIDGVTHSTVGEIEIDESNIEPDLVNNQDNSIGRIVKPSNYEAKLKFRHKPGLTVQDLLNRFFDLSLFERDLNQSIMLSRAFIKGKPMRNTGTGEYSEVSVVASQMRRV